MRKFITEYIEDCLDCNRCKPSNQKLAGLLQISVQSQRFEVISIDFLGPLPEGKSGKRWIFLIEGLNLSLCLILRRENVPLPNWMKCFFTMQYLGES
ncbi:reverse transcriptase [Caerostris darwini]|uniref:Reverse transcriptase n=1 Tax=Caerostris darwini TaxID=1538125 RepID=A0AAV4RYW0_9ARAC|nr:reverse transcriptase [Caerostris darwini]